MTLTYTNEQLTREAQLLVTELVLMNNYVIGDGSGFSALGIDPESNFAQTRHPDDLTELHNYEVWDHISRLEHYVQRHEWSESLRTDVWSLRLMVERTFSPAVVRAYEEERLCHPEEGDIPGPWEPRAGDVAFGHFHRGILAQLAALAAARLKMDLGERLTMGEIALLIDVREATVVTNAHRGNFESVEEGNRRYAEPTDVLPWMIKNGYSPTIRAEMVGAETPAVSEPSAEAVVFVPVARDGTWFSPETSSGGRYTIGAKGEEQKLVDYFAALERLVRMPTPRWRRKNGNGIPGIVAGVNFERKSRADLERALQNIRTSH